MSKKSWYSIKSLTAGGAGPAIKASISIHDEIGVWGVTARDFIRDYQALDPAAEISLSVHSPGGDVFEALAIYNTLVRDSARITARVEGLAASAASLILMAAGRIVMPENAYVMVHNPLGGMRGEADDMRALADLLDKTTTTFAGIYARRTGLADDEVRTIMADETWLSAADAVTKGFADETEAPVQIAALADASVLGRFDALPTALKTSLAPREMPEAPAQLSAEAVIRACAAAGEPSLGAVLIEAALDQAQLDARLASAAEVRALGRAGLDQLVGDAVLAAGAGAPPAGTRNTRLSAAGIYAARRPK
jgi:ATP-dependent Clp protease protease subunit